MNISEYKYIIFDFDMTIVDTEPGSIYSYGKAFAKAGETFENKSGFLYICLSFSIKHTKESEIL